MAGEAGYSFSLTTFSPSGSKYLRTRTTITAERKCVSTFEKVYINIFFHMLFFFSPFLSLSIELLQIEHAFKAVQAGKTALGIQATNGVVLCTEKKSSSTLVDEDSIERIVYFTESIGAVYAGMGPDFRVLVRKGQKKAAEYKLTYGETIPVLELTREIAAIMQEYTQSGGVRPFGVSVLVAGVDASGPQLYQVDPSGAYFGWRASAIGKNFTNAKTFLEKRYSEDLELEDAIHTALLTMREGFEGEMNKDNIELGIVGTDGRFRILSASEVGDYLLETA